MKKVCSLLVSPLIMLAGILPAWADGVPVKATQKVVSVVKGGTLAVQAGNSGLGALKAIEAMRDALAGTETRASGLAQIPTSPAMRKRFETDRNTALKFGWAAQVQGDGLTMLHARERLHTAELLPSKTAHSLLKNTDNIERLPQEQREYVMLANYPAAAIEGPIVLGQVQVERALATYQQIIENTPNISLGEEGFQSWAKCMAAAANIGFFSIPESADLIISAAKKVQSGILTGPTDVIATWALLNVGAPEKIQALADIRLEAVDGDGNPMMLPYEWREIQKYMQANNLYLVVPQNRIAPVPGKSTLSRIPTAEGWLGYYNPYNLFAANPSAENTANFMQLRKALIEKATAVQVKQSVTAAVPALTPKSASQIPGHYPKPFVEINGKYQWPAKDYEAPSTNDTPAADKPGPIVMTTITTTTRAVSPEEEAAKRLEKRRKLTKLYAQAQAAGSSPLTLEEMRDAIRGADTVFPEDSFAYAFQLGDLKAMDFWLEYGGVDLNAKQSGWFRDEKITDKTFLEMAVEAQNLETVKYLVDKGADVSTLDWLPLEFSYNLSAIKDIVIYIIDHGGATAVDAEGVSLLDRINVAAGPTIPILQHLYDNGIDITEKFYHLDLIDEGIILKKGK